MKKSKMSRFANLYLFAFTSKSTMAIYYLAFVLVYLLLGKISGGADIALEFPTAFQMLFACILIGFGQGLIVPVEHLNILRSAVWMIWSSIIAIGFTLFWGWFNEFPLWCGIVFCIFMPLGFAALLLGLLFDSQRETKKLNEHLKMYQSNLQ